MRLRRGLVPAVLCLLSPTMCLTAADPPRTGISVAPPKVFDNRSLVIMLEQLEKQLGSITVIESQKEKLLAALANFQGARITDISRALSVTGPSLPKVVTTDTAGDDGTGLQPTGRATDQAASTPTAPSLPTPSSALSFSPSFGAQAEDLLSDQVSLSYQIINVRMLLERALSDRLHDGHSRVQVVLGFQIGIDPPREAKDKAAFVELTVTSADGTPMSLVSVMPYEKTYNAYAIDRRSNAFGGAAIAKVVSIGYGEQRRSESLYVYKDADTLALGDPALGAESDKITFGWEFRPVLGRRSVSPGLRQMFAVVALPVEDGGQTEPLKTLTVAARTYWRKYDSSKSVTSGKVEKAPFTPLGFVQPMTTDQIGRQLGPSITDVQWRATDDKTAIVQVSGTNLFSGTQVILGSKVYDSQSTGLVFKSDHLVELRTTVSELAFGAGAVSGRYGNPVKLSSTPAAGSPSGIAVNEVRHTDEPGREFLPITIVLQTRDGTALTLPPEQPLISVGAEVANSVYGEPVCCTPVPFDKAAAAEPTLSGAVVLIGNPSQPPTPPHRVPCWQFTGMVSAARLHGDPIVSVKYPFRGDKWQATFPIHDAFSISGITNLGTYEPPKGKKTTRLAITGRGFPEPIVQACQPVKDATVTSGACDAGAGDGGCKVAWSVILDHEYKAPELKITKTLIQLEVEPTILAGFKSVIVQPGCGNPIVLKLPDGKPAPLEPSIDAGQQKSVKKETSVAVTFTGKDLNGVKAAKFDGKPLTIKVSDDGKGITVFLTRAVTAKSGTATVLLETEDGLIALAVTVEP